MEFVELLNGLASYSDDNSHHLICTRSSSGASYGASNVVKNLPANAGGIRAVGFIPGPGRSSRGGHGNPFKYSCLGNPMDREAWWATVHSVTELDMTEVT